MSIIHANMLGQKRIQKIFILGSYIFWHTGSKMIVLPGPSVPFQKKEKEKKSFFLDVLIEFIYSEN